MLFQGISRKILDQFSPFFFFLIPFIASQMGCFSSWIVSSRSSADVNCLKGGVNLITCDIVNVTREALPLPNTLSEKAPDGR